MDGFLKVGQIVNTHGIKGEVKVLPLTEYIERFDFLEKAYLNSEIVYIDNVKYLKDKVVLKIRGIDSIEEAEKFKRAYLEVSREDAIEPEEGEYFISDIVGSMVVDTEGFEYGKIEELIETGSNDVYWVKGNKEILVPVIKDIVLDINIDDKIITIKPSGEWQDED